MSEATVDSAPDSDLLDSLPASPNVEEEAYCWEFEGTLSGDFLIVALIHFFSESYLMLDSDTTSTRNLLVLLALPPSPILPLSPLPSPLTPSAVRS